MALRGRLRCCVFSSLWSLCKCVSLIIFLSVMHDFFCVYMFLLLCLLWLNIVKTYLVCCMPYNCRHGQVECVSHSLPPRLAFTHWNHNVEFLPSHIDGKLSAFVATAITRLAHQAGFENIQKCCVLRDINTSIQELNRKFQI